MRFDPHDGIVELDRHLDRLRESAEDLDFQLRPPCRAQRVAGGDLRAQGAGDGPPVAVADGAMAIEVKRFEEPRRAGPVALRPLPVDPGDFRLRYKTTDRRFYDQRAAGRRRLMRRSSSIPTGRLTEGSRTTIFVERDGRLLTPPLEPRADPGNLARQADRRGQGGRRPSLTPDDLPDGFFIGNIVRGLIPARLA